MLNRNSVIALFDQHTQAEDAIKQLQEQGFDLKSLSIVGKGFETEEDVVGYYSTCDRMTYWGKNGAFWGGVWGILFGSAFFAVPGLGPLLVAGPLVALIVSTLEGAVVVGGLSVIGAGLLSLGIPKDSVVRYETALKNDQFVLVASVSSHDATKAKEILRHTNPHSLEHHR